MYDDTVQQCIDSLGATDDEILGGWPAGESFDARSHGRCGRFVVVVSAVHTWILHRIMKIGLYRYGLVPSALLAVCCGCRVALGYGSAL